VPDVPQVENLRYG